MTEIKGLSSTQIRWFLAGIAIFRLFVFSLIAYCVLNLAGLYTSDFIQERANISEFSYRTTIQNKHELDAYYLRAYVSQSLQFVEANQNGSIAEHIQQYNMWIEDQDKRLLKVIPTESPFTIRFWKTQTPKNLSERKASNIYINVMLSFTRALQLLWTSQILMMVLFGIFAFVRTMGNWKPNVATFGKIFLGSVLLVVLWFSTLPEVYISTFLRPGQEILPEFDWNSILGHYIQFFFDVIFVMGFAGIFSQIGVVQLVQKTPEENMVHLRGDISVLFSFLFGVGRSSILISPMIPFLLTATLFCNARESRTDGIYMLVKNIFDVQRYPIPATESLILIIVLIGLLAFLAQRLMKCVQEIVFTIPEERAIR